MATKNRHTEISSKSFSLFYFMGLEWRKGVKSQKETLKDQTTEKRKKQ